MAVKHRRSAVSAAEAAQTLADIRFLAHVPRPELVALLPRVGFREFDRGEVVRQPGSAGLVYAVLDGGLHLCQVSASGREIATACFRAGESYGLAIFDQSPASHSALKAAVQSTSVCCIPADDVRRLVMDYPAVALDAMCCLSQSVRRAHETLQHVAFDSVRHRLIRVLLQLHGARRARPIAVTHAELAAMVGTSREQISREVAHLRDQGFIRCLPNTRSFVLERLMELEETVEVEAESVR